MSGRCAANGAGAIHREAIQKFAGCSAADDGATIRKLALGPIDNSGGRQAKSPQMPGHRFSNIKRFAVG
jgi:hypothetical protein